MSHALEAYARSARPASREERDRLVTEYLPLVHHVLGRLPIRLPPGLEREDLFEVGVLGLMNAAESYNPAKGAAFKTHAFVNIRGAILDEIRRHDPVPRSRRDRLRLLGHVERELAERLERPPTPEEIAKEARLSIEQVEESLVHAHGMSVLSLDDPGDAGDGDGPMRLVECLRMPGSPDPADEAARRELKARLAKAIEDLPERERRVVVLYYAHDLRLKEIGEIMEITESRVSQIHARALLRLHRALDDGSTRAAEG